MKPKISERVPTNRNTTIPNDAGPILACFDGDPTSLTCEIAQPSRGRAKKDHEIVLEFVSSTGLKNILEHGNVLAGELPEIAIPVRPIPPLPPNPLTNQRNHTEGRCADDAATGSVTRDWNIQL